MRLIVSEIKPSDKDSSFTKNPYIKVFGNNSRRSIKKITHLRKLGRFIDTYA